MTCVLSHRSLYLPHPNHKLGERAFEVEFAFVDLVEFGLIDHRTGIADRALKDNLAPDHKKGSFPRIVAHRLN